MNKTAPFLVLALLLPSVSLAAYLDGDASGSLSLGATVDVGYGANVGVGTSAPSQGSAGDDSSVSNTRGSAYLTTSGQVVTDADLDSYEASLREGDDYFVDATAKDEGDIEVSYYHDGRLFGIFPIKVKSRTEVTTNDKGQVVVRTTMPWWNLFVTGTGSVAAHIDEGLSGSGTIVSDMKIGGSAAARARVIEAIANAHMQARVGAAAGL